MTRAAFAALLLSLSAGLSFAGHQGRLPVAGLLSAHAPLRAQVIAQIQSLAGAPAVVPGAVPSLLPSAIVPQEGFAAVTPEAAAVLRGLLAHPELLEAHKAELSKALGDEPFKALAALAKGPKAETAKNLLGAGTTLDPADEGAIAELETLFDGKTRLQPIGGEVLAADTATAERPAQRALGKQTIHRSGKGEEAKALVMLELSLATMELPPYKELRVEREVKEPLVAWAGLPSIWKLSAFREGGRQDPGNALYVLDPSWYIQVTGADGKNRLYATKGVYFEKDGKQAVLVSYKHPRVVNYFGNWLTLGAFDTASGVPLEKDLDTPMSSSSRLEQVTNDKLWTRLLLASEGARVPATRAFLLKDHAFLKRGSIPVSARVQAGGLPESRAQVRKLVVHFLGQFKGPEVVVKPSGPRFHSGEGVRFFPRGEVDEITDHVVALSKHEHMDSQGVVLLEQRLAPPPIYLRLEDGYSGTGPFVYRNRKKIGVRVMEKDEVATAELHEKKDSNERVYVVRDEKDRPYTVDMTFFRAGTWGLPTSGQPANPQDAAAVVPFEVMREAWMKQHGVLATPEAVAAFMREREVIGNRALKAIMANERTLDRRDGEPYQAQTDMVGLDLMYQLEDGKLLPYVIEVNDHDAAGQHALDLFYPERIGEHSRVWVNTWRHRARQDHQRNP